MPQTVNFGDLKLPAPGFGAMGLSMFYGKTDEEQSKATLRKAIEIGCTVWNTSDVYGFGANERLIGSVLKEKGLRDKVFVITKFGVSHGATPGDRSVDCSPEYVAKAIDASIERLGFAPDAWAAHRMDKQVPIEDTVLAMENVRKAGKTKYLGLSECSAETLSRAIKVVKIDFIEVEYSPWTLDFEENGVFQICKDNNIAVLAYSPLGRGFLTGRFKSPEDFVSSNTDDESWVGKDVRTTMPRMQKDVWDHNFKLVTELQRLSEKKGCTSGQLALAWLMAQASNILPIPGTKSEKYLVENFASREIKLSEDELVELRKVISENKPLGDRYHAQGMRSLDS